MRVFVLSLLAGLILLSALPVSAAGCCSVLGVGFNWNETETMEAFAEAGIPEYQFNDPYQQNWVDEDIRKFDQIQRKLMRELPYFHVNDADRIPPLRCRHFAGSLETRDDITRLLACFNWDYQVLVLATFDREQTDSLDLYAALVDEYGEPFADHFPPMWLDRPWYQAGLIPRRLIFMEDLSMWLAYHDAWNLVRTISRANDDSGKRL